MDNEPIIVSNVDAIALAACDEPKVELRTPEGRLLGWFEPQRFFDSDKPHIVSDRDDPCGPKS